MKRLYVTIRAELEIPDEWELVEHPSGTNVLKIGDQFVDFDIATLTTTSAALDAEWTDADGKILEEVLGRVVGLDVELDVNMMH